MANVYDAFWIPKKLRQELLSEQDISWVTQYYAYGIPVNEQHPDAVGARWPVLSKNQWKSLLKDLDSQRKPSPANFVTRLQKGLETLFDQFSERNSILNQQAVDIFHNYTGYSPNMIRFMMGLLDGAPFTAIDKMIRVKFPNAIKTQYIPSHKLGGPEGWIRFYPDKKPFKLFLRNQKKLFPFEEKVPELVLGYASGNVLGTAFIITLLAQLSAIIPGKNSNQTPHITPSVLVKNSRQEPLFVPFLFSALEELDPELLQSVAIMIWDYEDIALQEMIVSQSDLIIAAASDQTIDQIDKVIRNTRPSARFHRHGHKVSFTTIGKKFLTMHESLGTNPPNSLFEETAMLAALDSILWDQNGCLSSRIHFVEQGDQNHFSPLDYANQLVDSMRILGSKLPRGNTTLSSIHDRFDHFNAQAVSPQLTLCSSYEDDFIVVLDQRPWNARQFASIVNTCMDRTVVIRPIGSLLDVPNQYLSHLSPNNLQTMYVAIDSNLHTTRSEEFSQFVEKTGKLGITSIRTVGQSPFPQLAYSWDGYLPHSLAFEYASGYFTTIEFDHSYSKIMQISSWLAEQLAKY